VSDFNSVTVLREVIPLPRVTELQPAFQLWTLACLSTRVALPSEESIICNADSSLADGDTAVAQESENPADFRQTMTTSERRFCRRLNLHWRLRLSSAAIGTLETRTENLSSRGFYCFLETPLVPGDVISCDIAIPNYSAPDRGISSIACQAEVIRVEAVGTDPSFGVACRILDFTLDKHTLSLHNGHLSMFSA
jgi:PilZ domain